MPLICYTKHKLREDAVAIIRQANEILEDWAARGFTLTLRQLFYQFVSRDLLANTQKNYSRLGDIITKGREAGLIDWHHIEDRGRVVHAYQHWTDPADRIDWAARSYRIDLWEDQPTRVEVWVEKDALSEIVGQAANEFDVPYFANKGYCSVSAMWDAGYNRFRQYGLKGQDVVVLHLGDHDPSGIDMTRDIQDRLTNFSRLTTTDTQEHPEAKRPDVHVRRIALNMDQIDTYGPPPNPAKVTDSRAASYIALHGTESWELDALDPQVLLDLIRDNIQEIMDADKYNARYELQEEQRLQLVAVAAHWTAVQEFLRKGKGKSPNRRRQ